jgi:hypothetical protein
MKNLKDAKDIYDHIVVPEELDARLRSALETATPKKHTLGTLLQFSKWTATAAAACLLCFTIGLNSSQSFAMEMSSVPFFGQIAKVLTIRSYQTTENNTTTTVEIPQVQLETADENTDRAITDVNAKIQSLVDEFTAKKQEQIIAEKQLFLDGGGTEEEWLERSIDVNVNYEVKHQSNTLLSLLVDGWISWYNFEEERHFYNIDLTTGKELTLKDFLGEDAYDYATECVVQQMKEQYEKDPENLVFWGISEDTTFLNEFMGVTEETLFYINANGNVIISFDKYQVAPGFMGIVEFEIPAK